MSGALGKVFQPADAYQGTRLSTMEALYSGITTVTDWSHINQTREHSEANIKAIADSGIRARYLYGPYQGQPPTQPSNMAELERFRNGWAGYSNDGLISLGMAWRGLHTQMQKYFVSCDTLTFSSSQMRKKWSIAFRLVKMIAE